MTSFSVNVRKVESLSYSGLLNKEHSILLRTCTEGVIPRQFPESIHHKWLKDFIKIRKDEKGMIVHELPTFASEQDAIAYTFPIAYNENTNFLTERWMNYIRRVNFSVALEAYTKDKLTLKDMALIKLLEDYPCTVNEFSGKIVMSKHLVKILEECPVSITEDLKNFAKYIILRFPFTWLCPFCYRLHTFSTKPQNLGQAPSWLLNQDPISYLQYLLLPEHSVFIEVDRFTEIWQRRNEFVEDKHREQKHRIFSVQQLEYLHLFKAALRNDENIKDYKYEKLLLSGKEILEVESSLRILPRPVLPYGECYCLKH